VTDAIFSGLSSNYRVMASIIIVDTPGFRNPAHCGRSSGASFEDFCHNYVQERLQLLFHDTVFTSKQDLYAQVGLLWATWQIVMIYEEKSTVKIFVHCHARIICHKKFTARKNLADNHQGQKRLLIDTTCAAGF